MSATRPRMQVNIRWMLRCDWPAVLAIEDECFANPWGEKELGKALRERNCIGVVAVNGCHVHGYAVYNLEHKSITILNLAVAKGYQGMGVGSQMVAKLIGKLSSGQREYITVNAHESNLRAQLFFRAMGFRATKVLREHFEDTREDAYVMRYRLGDEETP